MKDDNGIYTMFINRENIRELYCEFFSILRCCAVKIKEGASAI